MKFSLIVPTLGRVWELERLFKSLLYQGNVDFEVIIVDQNRDERLVDLINTYQHHFPVLHIRTHIRGVSRARNRGFQHVKGQIVAFPDDDCIYTKGLLVRVARLFDQKSAMDGLLTRVFDLENDENAFKNVGDNLSGDVDFWKAYRVAVSPGIFLRKVVTDALSFDENLGVGAGTSWSSGEETDFIFKSLKAGFRIYYDADLLVRHPDPLKNAGFRELLKRAYAYGVGHGYFLATHDFLSRKKLIAECNNELSQAPWKLLQGNWRMANYSLLKGVGTYWGYLAGMQKKFD